MAAEKKGVCDPFTRNLQFWNPRLVTSPKFPIAVHWREMSSGRLDRAVWSISTSHRADKQAGRLIIRRRDAIICKSPLSVVAPGITKWRHFRRCRLSFVSVASVRFSCPKPTYLSESSKQIQAAWNRINILIAYATTNAVLRVDIAVYSESKNKMISGCSHFKSLFRVSWIKKIL